MNYIDFEFTYKGNKKTFSYEIPNDVYAEALASAIYHKYDVRIDGMDNDVIHMCEDMNCAIDLEDEEAFQTYCKEKCEQDAYEKFVEEEEWQEDYRNE